MRPKTATPEKKAIRTYAFMDGALQALAGVWGGRRFACR
jgi:hypothetical protein